MDTYFAQVLHETVSREQRVFGIFSARPLFSGNTEGKLRYRSGKDTGVVAWQRGRGHG